MPHVHRITCKLISLVAYEARLVQKVLLEDILGQVQCQQDSKRAFLLLSISTSEDVCAATVQPHLCSTLMKIAYYRVCAI